MPRVLKRITERPKVSSSPYEEQDSSAVPASLADLRYRRSEMQKRFIASAVGGLVGLGLAYGFRDEFGISQSLAYIGCALAGMAIGWVASTLFDVFAGASGVTPPDGPK